MISMQFITLKLTDIQIVIWSIKLTIKLLNQTMSHLKFLIEKHFQFQTNRYSYTTRHCVVYLSSIG